MRCHVSESSKPTLPTLVNSYSPVEMNSHQDLQTMIMQVKASSSRLEQKLNQCLWTQKVLMILVSILLAFSFSTFYMLCTGKRIY
ncbi:motile sperm domain-containing protein 2 isoform X1 [Arapaima gigas]